MAKKSPITLHQLAKLSGVSYKTLQKIFAQHGAPDRTQPVEELIEFIKRAAPGTIELPADLSKRLEWVKWQTAEEKLVKERELAEEKRLKNLETRGRLVDRVEVRAQGASLGAAVSSILAVIEKDGPGMCVGKTEVELVPIFREFCDKLRDQFKQAGERLAKVEAAFIGGANYEETEADE